MLQKVIDLLISKLSFQRVVKKLMQHVELKMSMSVDLKIQRAAIDALQETAENFLVESFENKKNILINAQVFKLLITLMINLLAIHVKRVITQSKNMKLLNNLRFSMIEKDISNIEVLLSFLFLMNADYERKSEHQYRSTLTIVENVEIAYVKKEKARRFVRLRIEKKKQ